MTKEQLTDLTIWLKDNVWRNSEVQYPCTMSDSYNVKAELIDIISSLHNLPAQSFSQRARRAGFPAPRCSACRRS